MTSFLCLQVDYSKSELGPGGATYPEIDNISLEQDKERCDTDNRSTCKEVHTYTTSGPLTPSRPRDAKPMIVPPTMHTNIGIN